MKVNYFTILYWFLPYINMNPPQVYTWSPSWTTLPPLSLYHPSGWSQCTSPKHPVSCIEPGLATRFIYDIINVSMPFSQIIPPSPSPTESKRLFYTSLSLLLSRIQGYCYHLSQFRIYALVYCIGVNFMIAVTIYSDFEAQENKICHCFHFFSIYLPWSNGTGYHDLSFLNVERSPTFFTLLLYPHQEAF